MSTKVRCFHYGEPVDTLIQPLRYEDVLENNGTEYEVQPILLKGIRVLKYDGKFAAIMDLPSADDTNELVCVFERMPDDLDIPSLCDDVLAQRNGEKPKQKPTIFRKIFEEGELCARRTYLSKINEDKYYDVVFNSGFPEDEDFFRTIKEYFMAYGYYDEEQILKLPHNDCNESYVEEVVKKMFQ